MSQIYVRLWLPSSTFFIREHIASFTLEQEAYTAYTQLHVTFYTTMKLTELRGIFRVALELEEETLHYGTVETLELVRTNGAARCTIVSRGLTALLLQNQLEPGLHTKMSLDRLMTEFYTFPKEITWERSTDTSNYLFVRENTSMWDGAANLTYKLYERYPFIRGANEIRMQLPGQCQIFYASSGSVLAAGMTSNQSRVTSDFYMADADGTYGTFHETDPAAQSRGIVRTRQLTLDRQYLYDPQQALIFRRKFAGRALEGFFVEMNGAVGAKLGDRLSYEDLLDQAVITRVRMSGDRRGVRTRLEIYWDAFYNSEQNAESGS